MRRALGVFLSAVPLALATADARAADAETDAEAPPAAETNAETKAETRTRKEDPFAVKSGYAQLFVSAMGGTGLRFNNPYRLATPLGDDAESVSRTAGYVDIGLAGTLGNPLGLQHGMALRTTAAVQGVGQVVMTPSYFVWRRWRALAAFGRAGIPLVLTPDVTWGLEASAGGAFFFLGGVGAVAEIVGDIFYGAGTRDVRAAAYPVLSGQLGILATYEVLP